MHVVLMKAEDNPCLLNVDDIEEVHSAVEGGSRVIMTNGNEILVNESVDDIEDILEDDVVLEDCDCEEHSPYTIFNPLSILIVVIGVCYIASLFAK